MKEGDTRKTNWTICIECHGQGRIVRGPSRKRRRQYQLESGVFVSNGSQGSAPKPLNKNLDICPSCKGSGLLSSDNVTEVDLSYPNIAIIGGGIGGAALAVACLHRGIPFTLYERDKSFTARAQGYGLTLQQASKAIEGLGIFSLSGGITSKRHVVHNPEGKIIGEWGLRKWNKPLAEESSRRRNVHISRQSLRAHLLEQLSGTTQIKWGHELVGFSENKQGSTDLTFQVDDKTETASVDLVVGADGIRSAVRELLIGEEETPLRYLGCIVVLGICPLKSLEGLKSPLLDSETVFQTVNGRDRIYVMPYDNDAIMWQASFKMDEVDAKAMSARGVKAMKEEVCRRFAWHEPIPQMLEAALESQITGYPVYDRKLLDPALLQTAGSATVLGDAAHPMSPFKGQGANQALLDALALARKISIECGPNSEWREFGLRKTVLNVFEKEMTKRTTSKVQDSAKAVELLHSDAVLHDGDEPRGRGLV